MQFIGLLDCNNFFVSCERLFRPDLRVRPTVVLSSNDGCIVARSEEIKDMSIPMGVPYFQVKDRLKEVDTAVFSSNFTLYRDISQRVFSVVRELMQTVEQYSIDESFLILEAASETIALKEIKELKHEIERRVGIPVSIGLSCTKTRAKVANKLAKKTTGTAVVDNKQFLALAADMPVGDVWGIGPRLARRFEAHGLTTVAELCAADRARIARLFGVNGVRLWQELRGEAAYRVIQGSLVQKSIMSSRSFKTPSNDLVVLEDAVAYHVRQVLEDLREMDQKAKHITVMIRASRHGDYLLRGGSRKSVLVASSSDTRVFMREAMQHVRKLFEPGVPYTKVGVVLGDFTPVHATAPSLFHDEADSTTGTVLMETIDALNRRFGNERIQLGGRLRTSTWAARKDVLSPAYTTRWSDIPSVTA